jgi:dolichol-phosphate mannosyltransferase
LIYLDEKRSFGGALDDADRRLAHYRDVIERAIAAAGPLPPRQSPRAPCGGLAG